MTTTKKILPAAAATALLLLLVGGGLHDGCSAFSVAPGGGRGGAHGNRRQGQQRQQRILSPPSLRVPSKTTTTTTELCSKKSRKERKSQAGAVKDDQEETTAVLEEEEEEEEEAIVLEEEEEGKEEGKEEVDEVQLKEMMEADAVLEEKENEGQVEKEETEEESPHHEPHPHSHHQETIMDRLATPTKALEEMEEEDVDGQMLLDEEFMSMAIQMAQSAGGERGAASAFPNPTVGAVLVSCAEDRDRCVVLGKGRSDYRTDAIRSCFEDAGLDVTPLSEWLVAWPSDASLREALGRSTLYVTLEPSNERRGSALPPLTHLVQQAGIARVVIGCADPVPERASKGAAALHTAGLDVTLGGVLQEDCEKLIEVYSSLSNSKLRAMARKHSSMFGRPLGFMHCSVVNSDNLEAFARQGNAFGTMFGGKNLSYRDFGSYEIAPPPELVWADSGPEDDDFETEIVDDGIFSVDFEDEYTDDLNTGNPMMPWYEQVDAVVATFPREGNGPPEDESIAARLNGLRWLATHGESLPAGVERILVMDATDLKDLPLNNDSPNLPRGVDVEALWRGRGRKRTRVLLRRGLNFQAKAAADAAAAAAQAAADAALAAAEAIESGDAARAAEAAIEYQQAAKVKTEFIQKELQAIQQIRTELESKGVVVETIEGGEPVDVMKHLGARNGLQAVVWRAGCWGDRGVKSILDGAFQWVSAHLAVDAVGGKFWQLMMAENAVQAACGPASKVKVFADQEDISLEYCDQADADKDCTLTIDGRPVRHVRLDCRIALVDEQRSRQFRLLKTKKRDRKFLEEEAPWFL